MRLPVTARRPRALHQVCRALLPALLAGCVTAEDELPSIEETTTPRPFCALAQPTTPWTRGAYHTTVWSAATVQREIRATLLATGLRCSPQGAYLTVYARMTAARDAGRCAAGDPLRPVDALDVRLNDALSDVMTRNYLDIARRCASGSGGPLPDPADPGGLWCEMHREALRDNRDAVRIATGSTGLYLSSHLALAVSALPHLDALWLGTPYTSLRARLDRMQAFKPTYDAFNAFLARNLDTVADALGQGGLLRGPSFGVAAGLAERLFPSALAFGRIRDVAWARGLNLALAIPRGRHPWTLPAREGFAVSASPARAAAAWPDDAGVRAQREGLVREGRETRDALATTLLGVLGGHNFTSLAAGTEAHRQCLAR